MEVYSQTENHVQKPRISVVEVISHLISQAFPDTKNKTVVEILIARVPSKIEFEMLRHGQRQVMVRCASIKCPSIRWRPVHIDIVQIKEFVMNTDRKREAAV